MMTKQIPLSAELLHGRPVSCEARREGDEFACACGKRWAVDDVEPPICSRSRHVFSPTPATVAARREVVFPPHPVRTERSRLPLPEELTDWQIVGMAVAYNAVWDRDGAIQANALRAAYRALLDTF